MKSAIEVEGLGYRYGRHDGVQDLTFSVPEGSIYGLFGPNGSGKSTTIRLLMGLLRRQAGRIEVLGMDPAEDPVGVKLAVGYVAENQGFYPWMRVGELLEFVANYRPDWDHAYASDLLDRFVLSNELRVGNLSRGQKAMVALLLALAFRPRLLILDEPTASLDPRARRRFFEGVLAGYQEEGGTILICSHLIHEVAGLVDYVGVIEEGRLVVSQPEETLRATVKRYRLVFAAGIPPADIHCPGRLRAQLEGRQSIVTVHLKSVDDTDVRAALGAYGASQIVEEPLSLEEAFLELLVGVD